MTTTISLPSLFLRALTAAHKSGSLPTVNEGTQTLISSALADLKALEIRISALGLFSPNETLEDISTRDLVYLLVPYVSAELQGRVKTTARQERVLALRKVENYLNTFLARLDDYEIVPANDRELHSKPASAIADPAARREARIQQFKSEKELRARIETLRKRRNQQQNLTGAASDYTLVASLLPAPATNKPKPTTNPDSDDELTNDNSEDDSDDDSLDSVLRSTTLLVTRLFYAQAHSQLESMRTELELLAHAPREEERAIEAAMGDDRRARGREADDAMWKLDRPRVEDGPLLDEGGRPLRPFTILPSGSTGSTAQRMAAQVFGPGHRLPSMSVDEYLQIEQERGNILTGGGPAQDALPTSSEQLALDAEQDGTAEGEEKGEAKRVKDESWAQYTDENQKGAGNTMNRG